MLESKTHFFLFICVQQVVNWEDRAFLIYDAVQFHLELFLKKKIYQLHLYAKNFFCSFCLFFILNYKLSLCQYPEYFMYGCGGLDEKCLPQLIYRNPGSLVCGIAWEGYRTFRQRSHTGRSKSLEVCFECVQPYYTLSQLSLFPMFSGFFFNLWGPSDSSQINTWRLSLTYECLTLA